MALYMGIDVGSAYTKGILLGEGAAKEGACVCPSGGDYKITAQRVREALLAGPERRSEDIAYTVATGYGSKVVTFADEVRSDIACHARGVHHLYPSVKTAVDVGDLYSKVFRIDDYGNVASFLLSGKCAGGSGRVLQVIARVLQLKVEDIGGLSLQSKRRVDFNTGCVVFAESEAISRVAEGAAKEDLLAGIHAALAAQLNTMAERLGIEKDLALVGGGARDVGLVKAVEELKGFDVIVPPEPQLTAALGAALAARERSVF